MAARARRDPPSGYATSFLAQMEEVPRPAVDRGVKVVTNAGGLNPAGLAAELRALAGRLGLTVSVAHVEGDDLLGRLDELKAAGEPLAHLDTGQPLAEAGVTPVTANAYLGAWGIVAALEAGADVVVSGRVTDASLVVGPAAWHFGWAADDWDRARRGGGGRPRHRVRAPGHRRQLRLPATSCPTPGRPASRSPRWPPTAAPSSPSIPGQAGWSRWAR